EEVSVSNLLGSQTAIEGSPSRVSLSGSGHPRHSNVAEAAVAVRAGVGCATRPAAPRDAGPSGSSRLSGKQCPGVACCGVRECRERQDGSLLIPRGHPPLASLCVLPARRPDHPTHAPLACGLHTTSLSPSYTAAERERPGAPSRAGKQNPTLRY